MSRDWDGIPAELRKTYPHMSRAVWRLVEHVMTDFVEGWYKNVSQNTEFPNDVRAFMEHALAVLSVKLMQVGFPLFS